MVAPIAFVPAKGAHSRHQTCPAAESTRMFKRSQIALLAGFGAIGPLSIDMYLPAMPQMAGDLHVSAVAAGQSVSVFFLGMALGQLVAGPWSDRLGRKPLILGGLVLYLAGSAVATATTGFGILLVARLAQALGSCAVAVTGRAVVRDGTDHHASAQLFSLMALISGLAPVLAPGLGNGLVLLGSWRVIFVAMGLFGAVLLVATLALLGETRSAETEQQARDEHPLRSYLHLLKNPRLQGNLGAAACNSACMFTYIANAPAVLMGDFGVGRTMFSILFSINAIGLVGASQLNRRMLRRWSPQRILGGSARNALVLATLFAGFAMTGFGGLTTLLVLLFMVISSVSIVQANTIAGALAADPTRSGAASALFGAVTFAAGALASWVAGQIHLPHGGGLAITIASCLLGCATAIRLGLQRATPETLAHG